MKTASALPICWWKKATLKRYEAQRGLTRRDLKNAFLYAPGAGIIQDRILEIGDMASPQKPVFTIALTNPLWVRAYVPEPDLGKIRKTNCASACLLPLGFDSIRAFRKIVNRATPIPVVGPAIVLDALSIQAAVGYMPQRFGLYEDLTVQENPDLYADLQGLTKKLRPERYRELMRTTGLEPFTGRRAGRLSGGMK